MVTRDILHLTIDSFLDVLVKRNFPLLTVGWHLFRVVSCNGYVPRSSTGNVFVARWVIPFVTIPLLDLVMIH